MCSKNWTERSTKSFSDSVELLRAWLDECDALVIGAGAGLSTSAGFVYSGERFEKYFGDFGEKYGFRDMYSGGFYPYQTEEETWGYWSRYILVNRYTDPPKPVYDDLLKLAAGKDYFVLTTNVDHCFQKAGFDKARLFYTQGDFGLFQCSVPCHQGTYDNEEIVRRMIQAQQDGKVPAALLPRCPKCGAPMAMNLRADDKFVEDAGWHAHAGLYADFLRRHGQGRVLLLELGVGGNTPGIIKYPFWRMTLENPDARYACINFGEAVCPPQIEGQSLCIDADIGQVLTALAAS